MAVVADAGAALAGLVSSSLSGPTVVVDFSCYKPPEELRVMLEDVYEQWKEDLIAGNSLFSASTGATPNGKKTDDTNGTHPPQSKSTDKLPDVIESAKPPSPAPPPAPPAPAAAAPPPASQATAAPARADADPAAAPPSNVKNYLSLPVAEMREVLQESIPGIDNEAKETLIFQLKVFKKAGLSDAGTFLPKSVHPKYCGSNPKTDLDSAMVECKMAVCGAFEGLLKKLNMNVDEIDILVTTCSVFCPTPSMSSMVANHFKMKSNVQTYSLGGMGCANGVVAINLMRDLLKAHPNSNAVLLCNETTTPAVYKGKDKHRLVTNVLFRMGASAILLSNKPRWVRSGRAKYVLTKALRVHIGARDDAYRAIRLGPDDQGIDGIYLGLNVVTEATKALTIALTRIGRYALTPRQLLQAAWHYVQKFLGRKSLGQFTPCFAEGVQHFLIHAGGAKVLDGIGSSLKLSEKYLEPSRAVLWDYGNVSSSTTWYSLGFIEAVRGVRKGDKIMQIGVGSGIKCGVNMWKALRDVDDFHEAWEHRVTDAHRVQVAKARSRAALASAAMWFVLLSLLVVLVAVLYKFVESGKLPLDLGKLSLKL